MQKKLILALAATALVAAALIGVALAQSAGAQTQTNSTTPQQIQLPNGQTVYTVPSGINGTILVPCYPYGIQQGAQAGLQQGAPAATGVQQGNIPNYGVGARGICGRFW